MDVLKCHENEMTHNKEKGSGIKLELSPAIYHRLIRPKWINQMYIHNRIQKHLKLHDKNVLDFGAGTGANCNLCKPGKYVGIDPDEKRIHFAKKIFPEYDFDLFENDEINVKNNSIDVILIIAVLHHIPPDKIRSYVKQFKQKLNPGGRIIAVEPCFSKKSKISNWYMDKSDNGSFIQNEEGYFDYFKREGFQCETIQMFRKLFLYNELFFTAYYPNSSFLSDNQKVR
ncbi:class I SAM-dependent methyltransferase [Aquibacillus sediminis]|uniref:class I SAM-dependent methyltransferase n=1 Tax=Aquibacillus sediminis TaxID=2574734 RepID=UPI001109CEF4|nr:class I SAM-dependent methyltransferase [Aquibacillus sediminis]